MSDTPTTCRLCLREEKLVKSHIVSEFLYTPMYDEKTHRFLVLSTNAAIPERTRQTGLYERLLCANCDGNLLGQYEDYAAKVLNGGPKIEYAQVGNELRMKGVDYTRLKMFYLSLLWRMSVARHEFFQQVDLGPHEGVIRKMILSGDPGEPEDYGVFCVAPLFKAEFVGNWMLPPDWVRDFGRRIYRCLIGGMLYNFFVGKGTLPKPLIERLIQKSGTWVIHREKIENIGFLKDLVIRMGRAIYEREQRSGTSAPLR